MASRHPPLALLGGLTAPQFLRDYWQRKPLLVRQAVPGFAGCVSATALRALAQRDSVQSRLIVRDAKAWSLEHGPVPAKRWRSLDEATPWTLLVQDLNVHVPAADALLRQFSFIPHARVDDVMVSLACPGGGVGPHVDSYDVFLLQGPGRRRWRISQQQDLQLRPGLPLKILRRFKAEQEWVLEPGDMLYLPPHVAHEGTALETCFTYSIGFRAPTPQQWLAEFLVDQAEQLAMHSGASSLAAMDYRDPDLRWQRHPGAVPRAMQRALAKLVRELRFSASAVAEFNGRYLSEPKPHAVFAHDVELMVPRRFRTLALRQGVRLDPRTRLLFSADKLYCNGETFPMAPDERHALVRLADRRALSAAELAEGHAQPTHQWEQTLWPMLQQWHEDGWLLLGDAPPG